MSTAAAIVVAGGSGARMGAGMPKAFIPLAGRPLLAWAVEAIASCPEVGHVVLVVPRGHEAQARAALGAVAPPGLAVVAGGDTRSRSVLAGLAAVPDGADVVLVHDAARPLVTPQIVASVVAAARSGAGAVAASPVTDTLKRAGDDLVVTATVDRDGLWRAETPQAFPAALLRAAYSLADDLALDAATDCAGLVEELGARVRVVPSATPNLKVTTPADVDVAERLLRAAGRAPKAR